MPDHDLSRNLARRYLDLWERQAAAAAADPELARRLLDWFARDLAPGDDKASGNGHGETD